MDTKTKRAGAYDVAFRDAVAEGLLTPAEAYARGSRAAYVDRLVDRHGLSRADAERVADNRSRLADLVAGPAVDDPSPPRPDDRRIARKIAIVTVTIFALTAVSVRFALRESADAAAAVRTAGAASDGVSFDRAGHIVRVVGATPDDVLRRYCLSRERRCAPLGLVATDEAAAAVRIGVLRDRPLDENALALPIRFDVLSQRWYAGDGTRPLVASRAPDEFADGLEVR